jgi:hypothetical protein
MKIGEALARPPRADPVLRVRTALPVSGRSAHPARTLPSVPRTPAIGRSPVRHHAGGSRGLGSGKRARAAGSEPTAARCAGRRAAAWRIPRTAASRSTAMTSDRSCPFTARDRSAPLPGSPPHHRQDTKQTIWALPDDWRVPAPKGAFYKPHNVSATARLIRIACWRPRPFTRAISFSKPKSTQTISNIPTISAAANSSMVLSPSNVVAFT